MASNFTLFQDEVTNVITALALALTGGGTASVVKRKVPKAEEQLDVLPLIVVAPSRRPSRRALMFSAGADGRKTVRADNRLIVAIVAAGNREPVAGLDDYGDWREQIARAFGEPYTTMTGASILQIEVDLDVFIDPAEYGDLYDYIALELNFVCAEPARAS